VGLALAVAGVFVARRVVGDLDEVDGLVVADQDRAVVVPLRPGVRIVLAGGPDAFAGPCGELAGASENRAPPAGSRGRP